MHTFFFVVEYFDSFILTIQVVGWQNGCQVERLCLVLDIELSISYNISIKRVMVAYSIVSDEPCTVMGFNGFINKKALVKEHCNSNVIPFQARARLFGEVASF